eukprot:363790-Chlamydomonas_euryale.AAC.10
MRRFQLGRVVDKGERRECHALHCMWCRSVRGTPVRPCAVAAPCPGACPARRPRQRVRASLFTRSLAGGPSDVRPPPAAAASRPEAAHPAAAAGEPIAGCVGADVPMHDDGDDLLERYALAPPAERAQIAALLNDVSPTQVYVKGGSSERGGDWSAGSRPRVAADGSRIGDHERAGGVSASQIAHWPQGCGGAATPTRQRAMQRRAAVAAR